MEHQSEVARIREQIAREYQAAQQIFGGFTPTAKHEFLIKRQENLRMYFEELKKHMSPEDENTIEHPAKNRPFFEDDILCSYS